MTSATERLRALLDERGVEYRVSATGYSIDIGPSMTAYTNRTDTTLDVSLRGFTPEQAVAATLGETPTPPPPTMPEQPPYDLLIDLLRDEWGIDVSWDGLRRFWYVGLSEEGVRMRDEREAAMLGPAYEPPIAAHWDGDVLVLTTPRDPSSIHVQRAEGQPRKVYPSEATLGPGTCREVKIDRYWRGCGECGYVWEFMYGIGKCERPRYRPNCGRKVVG